MQESAEKGRHGGGQAIDIDKLIPEILLVSWEDGRPIVSFKTRSGMIFDLGPEELQDYIASERGSGYGTAAGTDQALDIFDERVSNAIALSKCRYEAAKRTPYLSIMPQSFYSPKLAEDEGILEYEEVKGKVKFKGVNFHRLADYIMENFYIIKVVYPKRGIDRLMHYCEGVYVEGTDHLIKFVASQILGERSTEHYIREVTHQIRSTVPTAPDMFLDTPQNDEVNRPRSPWVCLKNGIVNVHTKEFRPHSPEMIFAHKLNVNYDPAAGCPEIEEFFRSSLDGDTPEGAEKIRVLKEFAGYTLDPGYVYAKALMNVSEGRSGKSTYARLIEAVLGSGNVSSVPLQQLDNDKFAMSALFGKRANIAGELSPKTLRNESVFKKATGQDPLECEFKGQNHFGFHNDAKFIFSCNQLPPTEDNSVGFWSRWILLVWPHNFEAEGRMDPNLEERIHTEAELSGFLNLMLDGLGELKKRGGFGDLANWESVRETWNKLSDTVTAFVEECLDVQLEEVSGGPGESAIDVPYTPQDDIYRAYQWYCQQRLTVSKSKDQFYKGVRELTGAKNNLKPPKASTIRGRPSCFKGLRWSEDMEEAIEKHLKTTRSEGSKNKGRQLKITAP